MKFLLGLVLITCSLLVRAQEYGSWHVPVPDLHTWYASVPDFKEVQPGEHPRLLFRQKDIPALRKKMKSTEGQAIIKRLRYLLDGANGESLPKHYNQAKQAYTYGGKKNLIVDTAGIYTYGHMAGYGLLYQLTGDKRYAELGRQCFELALAGQRDRDDRYSWVKPGGPLRAGVVLGWMAVGYDLCYNGWDTATRRKLGQAMEYYSTGEWVKWGNREATLEAMVTGTMPPKSNHFGMMAGGTALVLLALHNEPWANQTRMDSLLQKSKLAMVHNVTQGFGTGGYFAEGDGTGSMASHLVYLAAVQGYKNALGMDFVNSGRSNVYMTALKWFYLTVTQQGAPVVWPIRGGYSHNVWSSFLSGGYGYVGQGFGAVPAHMQPALLWYYYKWIHDPTSAQGAPYEVSKYPHFVVTSFVNWPVGTAPANPATILPHGYTDSIYGFYAWRNRWQNENDAVVTWLTQAAKGFMGAKPDSGIHVLSGAIRYIWAHPAGKVLQQQHNERWNTSSLRLQQDITVGVDVSGKSGYDVLLLSTHSAEGEKFNLAGTDVYVKGIGANTKRIETMVKNNVLHIGRQRISLKGNHFQFL